ncbi:Vacuolar amino acid transporter 2 [Yarrowia sp. C11]|nr:Vacuolar amino acid transporter 2 [Yarrowia sp. C11]KAG5370964.1 Vacuolar amino acid transporter 2 [Yarrowia sp. E02]
MSAHNHVELESLADSDDYQVESDNDDSGHATQTLLGNNPALAEVTAESEKSNMKMAFMNMANSIIGAGIIGQPYAVHESGLIAGVLLLVGLTFLIDWTIRLIVVNAKLSGTDTYQATCRKCFGKTGLIAISLAQGCFAFGGSIAFCVIIGDTIPHVLGALFPSLLGGEDSGPSILVNRQFIIVVCTCLISYPLALNRNIAHLAKASALALVSMLVIVILVIVRGPQLAPEYKGTFDGHALSISSGLFQGVSVISFAFVCHHNSLLIYDSLKRPTMDRFATVTHWSTGVSMVACLAMGVGGFIIFVDKTKGNVLNNFPATDVMANVARFCFGFNMLTTLPLEIFVCREVFTTYFWPGDEFKWMRHIVTTTVMMLTAMCVALVTCNLGVILELVGATSACVMAYILPPLCYLKLTKNKSLKQKAPYYLVAGFGVLVMLFSTIQSLLKIVYGEEEGSHCDVN